MGCWLITQAVISDCRLLYEKDKCMKCEVASLSSKLPFSYFSTKAYPRGFYSFLNMSMNSIGISSTKLDQRIHILSLSPTKYFMRAREPAQYPTEEAARVWATQRSFYLIFSWGNHNSMATWFFSPSTLFFHSTRITSCGSHDRELNGV